MLTPRYPRSLSESTSAVEISAARRRYGRSGAGTRASWGQAIRDSAGAPAARVPCTTKGQAVDLYAPVYFKSVCGIQRADPPPAQKSRGDEGRGIRSR